MRNFAWAKIGCRINGVAVRQGSTVPSCSVSKIPMVPETLCESVSLGDLCTLCGCCLPAELKKLKFILPTFECLDIQCIKSLHYLTK